MTLKYFAFICFVASLLAPVARAQSDDFLSIEPDIICRRQSSPRNSLCPKLEHLRFRLGFDWSEALSFRLAYDAQHQTKVTWHNSYDLHVQRLPDRKSWLDDYGLRLRFASDWELGLEDWSASTLIPDASGLGFARLLQDSGWNQTALRLSWINPEKRVLAASLIVGQGEGERLEETDSTPYFGALTRLELIPGLSLQLAWSYDGDALPADSLFWLDASEREDASAHFRASRKAASLFLDGTHPLMRGLQLSLGWQENRIQGPESTRLIAVDPSQGPFEPTELLAETLGGRSDLTRQTYVIGASYEILDSIILAFHWQKLKVDLGEQPLLQSCQALDSDGRCIGQSDPRQALSIQATTLGFGKKSDKGWSIMIESMQEAYDRLYENYHFAPGKDKRQRSLHILQLRLSSRI